MPHAGHVIDRVDRRKLMIAVDVLRAGACLLSRLARTPALLPFAYAGVILISIGSAYFEPASRAALPNIVSAENLGYANVLMGSTWGTMLAVGAALGGAVTMLLGRDASFVFDAVSFLLSAALLWSMRGRFTFLPSMRETVHFARRAPRILGLLTVKGGYGLGGGVVAMLSVFGREVFQAGAFGIGLLFAARGAGGCSASTDTRPAAPCPRTCYAARRTSAPASRPGTTPCPSWKARRWATSPATARSRST